MQTQWNRLTLAALATLLAGSVTFGVVTTVGAQTQNATPQTNQAEQTGGKGGKPGMLFGRGGPRGLALTTVAQTLNLSEADLQTALQSGKSIADIAAEKVVALTKVIDALIAEQTTRLQQAVTSGRLTQQQADAHLANLRENLPELFNLKRVANGPGFGMGRGGFGKMGAAPATVAQTLGITEAELMTALQAGNSVADVAQSKNVALDKVITAVVTEQSERLKQAVSAGRLTQTQADAVLATLKENLPELLALKGMPGGMGPGFGRPFGPGHRGGERGQHGQQQQPPAAPVNPQAPSDQSNDAPANPVDGGNA